jgi:hypothetical protein
MVPGEKKRWGKGAVLGEQEEQVVLQTVQMKSGERSEKRRADGRGVMVRLVSHLTRSI